MGLLFSKIWSYFGTEGKIFTTSGPTVLISLLDVCDLTYSFCHRTQDRHHRPGQCRQDYHIISVPNEWGRTHVTDYRLKRRRSGVEQYTFHHVGFGWTTVSQSCLVYLLLQHRGMCKHLDFVTFCPYCTYQLMIFDFHIINMWWIGFRNWCILHFFLTH